MTRAQATAALDAAAVDHVSKLFGILVTNLIDVHGASLDADGKVKEAVGKFEAGFAYILLARRKAEKVITDATPDSPSPGED